MSSSADSPLFFGPPDRPLFGWLRQPIDRPPTGLGVVLCPPVGQESLNAHKTVRHIAARLAEEGFPTLRFDYDGCGNSAGDDRDPDRLDAWIGSVRTAIDTVKQQGNVEGVLLVGLRFGAALATLAALSRPDVKGVIAIAPVVSGRVLVREWKAMGLVRSWRRRNDEDAGEFAPTAGDGSIEAAGFVVSAQTCESVGKVNLSNLAPLGFPILVLDRDDGAGNEHWVNSLLAADVSAERKTFAGFLAMMRDPAYCEVPLDMVQMIVTWAQRLSAQSAIHGSTNASLARGAAGGHAHVAGVVTGSNGSALVIETLLVRDDDGLQFGVLSEPLNKTADPLPLLLLVNSGAVHHVGPNRLYVLLARHFAASGFRVLRVDLSGLGDSQAHQGEPEVSPYSGRGTEDIERWLQHVSRDQQRGPAHLLGICSGAYHAFRSSIARLPLETVFAINPVTFYWSEGMPLDLPLPDHQVVRIAAGYRRSLMNPEKWRKVLAGHADLRLAVLVARRRASGMVRLLVRGAARVLKLHLKDDLARDLKLACNHSTRLEFLFSEGDPGLRILREQGGATVGAMRKAGKLNVSQIAGADHTFSSDKSRQDLISTLSSRISQYR